MLHSLHYFRLAWVVFLACAGFVTPTYSQADIFLGEGEMIEPEFTIPPSAAFDMLGAFPAQIMTPSTIRDFKVDWSFQSWRLNPNLALQAQPIWEVFYNKPSLERYRLASPLMRMLSTLDVSAGTMVNEISQRRVSMALKLNLYREIDPLADPKLYRDMEKEYRQGTAPLKREIARTTTRRNNARNKELQDSLAQVVDSLEFELRSWEREQKEAILAIASEFMRGKWNASGVELSVGKAFLLDETATLKRIKTVGDAWVIWLNGAWGIGKTMMLSSVLKYVLFEHQDSEGPQGILNGGINFRYGGWKYNFFTEVLATNAGDEFIFDEPALNFGQFSEYSVALGGDWKISRNVLLSYGVRCNLASDFGLRQIRPTAGISCMMR